MAQEQTERKYVKLSSIEYLIGKEKRNNFCKMAMVKPKVNDNRILSYWIMSTKLSLVFFSLFEILWGFLLLNTSRCAEMTKPFFKWWGRIPLILVRKSTTRSIGRTYSSYITFPHLFTWHDTNCNQKLYKQRKQDRNGIF